MKRNATWLAGVLALVAVGALAQDTKPQRKVGYTDTPMLPSGKWRVHDGTRPQPTIVNPGPGAATPAPAPADAIVLFDGKDTSKWANAGWKAQDGAFAPRFEGEKVVRVGNNETKDSFEDYQLHIEWCTPTPHGEVDQGRGNSGVMLAGGRYEIQVLDSYDNITYPDGQAAAVYGQTPPLVNASRKPGEWQTYDIFFTSPRFDADGKVTTPAYVTVIHNGVLVQNHTEILGVTNHRTFPKYTKHDPGPIQLQDHGNAVRYRNIWLRPLKPGS